MSAPRRRGAIEATVVLFLAAVLAAGVIGSVGRRMDASRHAVRLELHAELATALESTLDEAWWQLCRASPARTGGKPRAARAGASEPPALYSRVLAAICERTGSPGNPTDQVLTPLSHPADVQLDEVTLTIATLAPDRMSGLIALRLEGRARRGGIEVALSAEHRRAFEVQLTPVVGAGPAYQLGTVHLHPRLVSAEVIER